MPAYLTYLLIFAAALAWQAYCESRGWTFYIGVTCFALGIVGAVAGARLERHLGVPAQILGAAAGFVIGSFSTMAFSMIVWAPYNVYKWILRCRKADE